MIYSHQETINREVFLMSKTELRKEWERRFAVFRACGQTQAKWCAANGLKIHKFKVLVKEN